MTDQATKIEVVDPSQFDIPTLTKWYVELRKYKSDLEASIKPQVEHTKAQMDAIEAQLNMRLNAADVKSMRTEYGTVTQVQKTKFKVVDPYAFRQWIAQNPQVGVQLINASVTQSELKNYIDEDNALPDGIAVDNYLDISIRKA